jgi:tungstate transport system ATP-binding protein
MSIPLLELQGINQRYGKVQALRDINLTVGEGVIMAVVGASGAGKTTLLRLIAGLDDPIAGAILLRGSQADSNALRRIATMVFQRAVMFNTSVYENVAYALKLKGLSRSEIDRKVHETLRMVGLDGFEGRRAKKLSGGEQQRVSLARAIALEPEMLLLDEPTLNLDPRNVAIIESVISDLNRERKTTIILSTHNMLEARELASQVAVLRDGELAQFGDANEIFTRPSETLAGFARLRNIFTGEACKNREGLLTINIGGGISLEAVGEREGRVTVFISPEDIIVSKSLLDSSARNALKGKLVEAASRDKLVELTVDAGRDFTTIITRKSFDEMRLTIGSEVFLTFKAQSIHVI